MEGGDEGEGWRGETGSSFSLPPIWDIYRLKHPFYALVYAAKGPFVLYKIYNIIFEHGNDPPPRLNNVKKNSTFLTARLPLKNRKNCRAYHSHLLTNFAHSSRLNHLWWFAMKRCGWPRSVMCLFCGFHRSLHHSLVSDSHISDNLSVLQHILPSTSLEHFFWEVFLDFFEGSAV